MYLYLISTPTIIVKKLCTTAMFQCSLIGQFWLHMNAFYIKNNTTTFSTWYFFLKKNNFVYNSVSKFCA